MPIRLTYGCSECSVTWKSDWFPTRADAENAHPSACPNGCGTKPAETLSAPAVRREGGAKQIIDIPQTQSKREQLAADLALKHTGMTDINTNMKVGDIAAKPLPTPVLKDIPEQHRASLQEQITPGFRNYGQTTGGYKGVGVSDPYARRNLGIIGGGNKLPPVQHVPGTTRHMPRKGK